MTARQEISNNNDMKMSRLLKLAQKFNCFYLQGKWELVFSDRAGCQGHDVVGVLISDFLHPYLLNKNDETVETALFPQDCTSGSVSRL